MSTPMKIWMIDGQGGLIFSGGWRSFSKRLISKGYDVSYGHSARYPYKIAEQIANFWLHNQQKCNIIIGGYSLGGNSISWVAQDLYKRYPKLIINLVFAYDPTVNAEIYPLQKNVKRALSYHNTGRWGTSIAFGGAVLKSAEDGPKVEITDVNTDHLLFQFRSDLHTITENALETLKKGT